MALILNIDTSGEQASVTLSEDGIPVSTLFNGTQKDHAAWLHPTIDGLLRETKRILHQLHAVAVSNGPGSYTGLRIGLSAAKGICFAMKCPLITIPTTEMLAEAVKTEANDLIIPLIDARRNEVFTAVYDKFMRVKNSPYALILEPDSFDLLLEDHNILFCGNAVNKARPFIQKTGAQFSSIIGDSRHLSALAERYYSQKSFADLAYSEPFYTKEFHSTASR